MAVQHRQERLPQEADVVSSDGSTVPGMFVVAGVLGAKRAHVLGSLIILHFVPLALVY